jgi:hypothetical protein
VSAGGLVTLDVGRRRQQEPTASAARSDYMTAKEIAATTKKTIRRWNKAARSNEVLQHVKFISQLGAN